MREPAHLQRLRLVRLMLDAIGATPPAELIGRAVQLHHGYLLFHCMQIALQTTHGKSKTVYRWKSRILGP